MNTSGLPPTCHIKPSKSGHISVIKEKCDTCEGKWEEWQQQGTWSLYNIHPNNNAHTHHNPPLQI